MKSGIPVPRPLFGCLAAVLSLSLAAAGCGSGAKGSSKDVTIGLITKTDTNPFFVKMKEGAQKEAKAKGVKLMTAAGKFDGDNASQVTAMENMIAAGVKGILIVPSDTKAIVPSLAKARAKDIDVIALDTPPDPQSSADALFATNNLTAGTLIGKYAKTAEAGKPVKIAMLDLNPGITVGVLRHNGFLQGYGIKEGDPSISCTQYTAGDQAKGQTAMENCLQKDPGINLVYTINEPAALGAYTALKAAGKDKTTMIVSIDGGCTGVKAVQAGQIAATAQQYPLKMATRGVDSIVDYAKGGKKASGYTDTGVNLVTAKPQEGQASKDVQFGLANCWGLTTMPETTDTSDPATGSAEPSARGRTVPSQLTRVVSLPTVGPLVALLLACLFFSLRTDRFLSGGNLSLVVQQVMEVGTLAIGQTAVILTAGIDLSNGAVMAFGTIVMTRLAVSGGMPALLAILVGILVCAAFGALNGTLVTMARLPAFIVTLGTLNIAFALTHIYSHDQTVTGLPKALTALGQTFPFGNTDVTYGSVVMLAMFVIGWYVLRHTAAGRHVYAVGDNAEAARLTGISTRRLLITVYTVAGAVYGVAGLLLVGRTAVGDPQAGETDNLDSITAVVLGGISLFGGRGSIIGVLFGALIVGVIRNGLQLMGVASIYQVLITGILVILAVGVDQLAREEARVNPILEAHGLVKRYGHVTALDGVDFELLPGEILAVIGDNGAGKSSLIKALSGALIPDAGRILLDGRPVHFHSPADARRAGIETVYQDLAVAPALDIASNLFLGREVRRKGMLGSVFRLLDTKRMQAESSSHMQDLKIGIGSMGQAVETLSGGQRQGVAVARSAAFARHVVIMDEPTAALGVKESGMVLDLIREVRDRGLPVILISHDIPTVFDVADRVHIQRLGRRVAVVEPGDVDMAEAVAIMAGAAPGNTGTA